MRTIYTPHPYMQYAARLPWHQAIGNPQAIATSSLNICHVRVYGQGNQGTESALPTVDPNGDRDTHLTMPTGMPSATAPSGLLVPLLPTQDGPPDAVAVAAWHLAISNLVGVEVPHDLLGLWLFPERGGVVLLAPAELARDRVELPVPEPVLSQHQLYQFEERIRAAGYRSVVAVPVRDGSQDLGLMLFADLEAGRYDAGVALRLFGVVHQLVPSFRALRTAPPMALAAQQGADTTPQNAAEAVALACTQGRTGSEVLRLVSGTLHELVPHERIEVAVPGSGHGTWALLSSAAEGRRWGESTGAVSQAVTGIVSLASVDGIVLVEDLRGGPGLAWPSYRESRVTQRVRSVLGVRLSAAGSEDAWLLLGGPATGMFRDSDREVLAAVAPVLAIRVQGLRAQLDADVARAQSQTVQAMQGRAGRIAGMLAATPHWGEAVQQFVTEARESLGYDAVRFALRLGEDRFVQVEPGDLRPLGSLPIHELDSSDLSLVLSGLAAFLVGGPDGSDLVVPFRVAGRVIGALELIGGAPGTAGHPITAAQVFADLLAPHIELVRRSALPPPVKQRLTVSSEQ
jgi:hypothetical protein